MYCFKLFNSIKIFSVIYLNPFHVGQSYSRLLLLIWLYLYYCSAGIGVLNAARKTMARMLGNNEVAFESAKSQFWVVDAKVLYIMTLMSLLDAVYSFVVIKFYFSWKA